MSKKITTPATCICPSFRIELDGVILRKTATRPYQFATRGPNHAGGSDLPKCAGKPFMGGVPVNAICRTCGTVWTAARGAMLEQVFKIRQAEWKRIRAEMTAAGADVSDILKLCTEFVNKITPASCGLAAAPANEQEWEVRADVVQNPAPAGKVRVMVDHFSTDLRNGDILTAATAALEKDVALGLEIQHNLERRLAVESGLLDEAKAILQAATCDCAETIRRAAGDPTGKHNPACVVVTKDGVLNRIYSARAAAAKGDKEK
jgi:hypothetical protein